MTDATAGRGGVGVRLFVVGGEVVKRTFDQVGDSGRKMWAEIALGEKAANPGLRALSRGAEEARSGIDGLAGRAGPAGNVLMGFGAAGIAAAAGLGGLGIALGKAQDAMAAAADLTDTADRIGVGVEQLQRWNFVADEAGVSTETLQSNLEKLNGVLGAFKSGIGDGKLKPVFEELGITTEQLQDVQTSDQLLMILADTLGQVRDRAQQVKFARSLGIEESLPILRLGSEGIRDLSEEAERLGLVMGKDVVQALDEADRKLEVAQQRIDTTVRLSVAGLAGDFADLVGEIAGAIAMLARWDAQLKQMTGAGQRGPRGLLGMASDAIRGRTAEEGERARDEGAMSQPGWMTWLGFNQGRREAVGREQRLRADLNALAEGIGEYASSEGGFDLQGHSGGGRGRRSRSSADSDRRQRERERALDQLQRAELEAQRAAIQARFGPGGTEESALELARANITIDLEAQNAAREALRAQLEKAGALDDEAKARLEELRIAQTELAASRDARALSERVRDLYAQRLREETASERDAIDLLTIQEQMAGTARERYAIGRRILEAEQSLERKLLQAEIDEDGKVTRAERRRLSDMDRRQAGEIALFDHDEQERLREQFHGYGREIVQAIEAGRIGEYIGDRIKERLLDGALDMLFDASGGGKGSGGLFGAIGSWVTGMFRPGGGRASGGGGRAGFSYGIAEHGPELFLLGGQGQVTSAAETAKMVRELAGTAEGRGPALAPVVQQSLHFDLKGAVVTEDLLRQMQAMANQAEGNAVQSAIKASRKAMPALQQSFRRLRTV